ncbi:MAG: S8 family serine peptidase [Lachnospiraceae bacterium]|nr:S8 family serine peptidase [Lachnospiraceae bacterium]
MTRKLLGKIWLALSTMGVIGMLIWCQILYKDKSENGTYKIDEVVESISEDVEVEVLDETTQITAAEILDKYTNALAYRMKNNSSVFPKYLSPSKVIVDAYDTIILCYREQDKFQEQYNMLLEDSNTLFAEEIELDDIVLEDVSTQNYSGTLSYAPTMVNSRAQAKKLAKKGINRTITIGIADTGLYSENSVIAKYVDIKNSYDFVNDDNNVYDKRDDHATCVISSMLDVLGEDIATNNVRIINGKCLEDGVGSSYSLYLAICGLADRGCDIINMSLGGEGASELEEFAVNYATKKGCILIASAGNEGGAVGYPAAFEQVIGVSSINKAKEISDFSNFGEIEICAPGENIVCDSVDYTQCVASGTSFSSPIISGIVTLAMLEDESIDTKSEAMKKMRAISEDLGSKGWDKYYGYGLPIFVVNEEEPTTEESTTKKPVPTTEQPTTEKPEPTTPRKENPTTEEPTTEKPEPITTRPEEPTTEEPTTKKPEPITTRPEEPTTEKPTTEGPDVEEPTTTVPTLDKVVNIEYEGYSEYSDYKVDGHLHLYNAGEGKVPANKITFDEVDKASGYEIWYSDYNGEDNLENLNWYKKDTIRWNYYYDEDLYFGMDVLIKIRAYDEQGCYGEFSEVYEIKLIDFNEFQKNLEFNTFRGKYIWEKEAPFEYYMAILYRYRKEDCGWDMIEDVKVTKDNYTFTKIQEKTSYKVQLLCYYEVILNGKKEFISIGDDFSTAWREW